MTLSSKTTLSALAAISLLAAAGCSCNPKRYNVSVEHPDKIDKAIEVDVIAVGPTAEQRWKTEPVSKYFAPGNDLRRDAEQHTFRFNLGGERKQQLSREAEIWKQWMKRGATTLFVVGDLPGDFQDSKGNQDGRRLVLPLNECRWPDDLTTIPIIIKDSGLQVGRNPLPPEGR